MRVKTLLETEIFQLVSKSSLILDGTFVQFPQVYLIGFYRLYVVILMINRTSAQKFGKNCLGVQNVPEYVV